MTQPSTSAARKPLLDQQSFQQLLQAAYVLQEHNEQLHRAAGSNGDATRGLLEIVEIQRAIESQEVDATSALRLIAARALNLTGASGVAVGIIEGREIVYRVATGTSSQDEKLRVPIESSLSEQCVTKAQVVRYPDTKAQPAIFAQLCHQCGTKSLLAAPVLHDANVVGVLELRSDRADSFRETDAHITELMAGLLADVIERDCKPEWREAATGEKSAMLQAIETLRPELERLIGEAETSEAKAARPDSQTIAEPEKRVIQNDADTVCRCGNRFEGGEKFCGKCGTARFEELRRGTQSKLASMWYLQQQAQSAQPGDSRDHAKGEPEETTLAEHPASLEQIIATLSPAVTDPISAKTQNAPIQQPDQNAQTSELIPDTSKIAVPAASEADSVGTPQLEAESVIEAEPIAGSDESVPKVSTAIVPLRTIQAEIARDRQEIQLSTWTSASRAREWWEALKEHKPDRNWLTAQWNRHRGSVWVGISLIILLGAIFINGASGPKPISANPHRKRPAAPNLTLFEKLLVNLGLAEPPPAPTYLGNPATQVWIDVHTALYYCPGADFYGKTDGGKIISQREAQQNQFEPASREACD
jgi:putative methionine-R-sulfoxide reductase with GAF domain